MKNNEKKYEKLVNAVMSKAISMTLLTERNEGLAEQTKIIQKATAISIIEPLFDYMEQKDETLKNIVVDYKKAIKILQEHGILQPIENVDEYLKGIKKKDEKNNSSD